MTQQKSAVNRESRRPVKPVAPRKKKRRRLNDLDSDSTVDEEESEDEFQLSERSANNEVPNHVHTLCLKLSSVIKRIAHCGHFRNKTFCRC